LLYLESPALVSVYFLIRTTNGFAAPANASNTLTFYKTIAQGGDSGWIHWSINVTEAFELVTNLDTQGERESISTIKTRYQMRVGAGEQYSAFVDNWKLTNYTSTPGTPYIPEVPAIPEVPGYWNYTYVTHPFTQWDESGFRIVLAEELLFREPEFYPVYWSTVSVQFFNLGHSWETSTYKIRFIFYASEGGVFWEYETTFLHNPREWFRLDWDFDIEERTMSFELTEDNGSSILDLDLFDVSGGSITALPHIFTSIHNPWIGLVHGHATSFGHAYSSIDFIDAPYKINAWALPTWDDDWTFGDGDTFDQESSPLTKFDTVSQFSMSADELDTGANPNARSYLHDIDHFDALSYSYNLSSDCNDNGDYIKLNVGIYNIAENGTADEVLTIYSSVGDPGMDKWNYVYVKHGTDIITSFSNPFAQVLSIQAEVNIYLSSSSELFFEIGIEDADQGEQYLSGILAAKDYISTDHYTPEWLVVIGWEFDDDAGNDFFEGHIGLFDTVRKDFIGQAVGNIIDGFFELISWILTPIILIFTFIGGIILGGLEWLGDVFGVVIDEVLEFLDPLFVFLEDILDAFSDLIAPLLAAFLLVVEDIIDLAVEILGGIVTELVALGAMIIFGIWDGAWSLAGFETAPDLLALVVLALEGFVALLGGALGVLTWAVQMITWIGGAAWFILLLVWAWLVLFSAAQADINNAAIDWIERMRNKMFKNISPGPITIFGITIIPSYIPLIALVMVFTTIELGVWDDLIGWSP